jgi:hypothetical protein
MTSAQRKLVWEWIASLFLLAAIVLLTDRVMDSWLWLKWCALVAALVMRALTGQTYRPSEGNNVITNTIAEHPWLNWWGAACTAVVVFTAFLSMDALSHWTKTAILRLILLALAIAFGPAIVLVERRRFQERA